MNAKYKQSLMYIYWNREAEKSYLLIDEMKEKVAWFKAHGNVPESRTVRIQWKDNSYMLDKKGYYKYIYCMQDGKYHVYMSHVLSDEKNKGFKVKDVRPVGKMSNQIEQEIFLKMNGVTERKAFGYCDRELIYNCIPKQLYFINDNFSNRNLHGCSKVDDTNHYADAQKGRMPMWAGRKQVEGTVKPTEEYPFAFYIKSGHSAELGRYDTHEWTGHRMNFWLFGSRIRNISEDKDVTILCKASKYTYDSVIEHLFQLRLQNAKINDISVKDVLNCSIGYKHLSDPTNPLNRLDHIAAVVIARANQKMLDIVDRVVGYRNVLQIVVDSIIYKGAFPIGIEGKELGVLQQEVLDADFRMRGVNQYIFMKDGKCIDCAHSSFDENILTEKLEDINEWRKQ